MVPFAWLLPLHKKYSIAGPFSFKPHYQYACFIIIYNLYFHIHVGVLQLEFHRIHTYTHTRTYTRAYICMYVYIYILTHTPLASKRVADGLSRTLAWDDFNPHQCSKFSNQNSTRCQSFGTYFVMPLDPGQKFTILSIANTGAMAEMAKVLICLAGLLKIYLN